MLPMLRGHGMHTHVMHEDGIKSQDGGRPRQCTSLAHAALMGTGMQGSFATCGPPKCCTQPCLDVHRLWHCISVHKQGTTSSLAVDLGGQAM